MFAMQSKELDSVFVEQVLGVFVPNLVILLVNARPTRSCNNNNNNNSLLTLLADNITE